MEVIEESRLNSSSDEIEAYFNDLDKRLQSKVTVIEKKICDINKIEGDIFNLNSFEKNDYLIDNDIDSRKKHGKKKRRKSKKRKNNRSCSVHRRSTSRSAFRSRKNDHYNENKVKNDKINFDENQQIFDKQNIELISDESLKKFDSDTESNVDITPKRTSLENRIDSVSLQYADKSAIDTDNLKMSQKSSQIDTFYVTKQKNYHFMENQYYFIKQYDKSLKDDYNLNKINHDNFINNNQHLNDKNYRNKPVKFVYSESNSIKNEINLSVSNLTKCMEKYSDTKNGHFKTDTFKECVLGELINKNLSDKKIENDSTEAKNEKDANKNKDITTTLDDLEALRDKFREQLEQRLFEKCDKKILEKIKKEKLKNIREISPENKSTSSLESDLNSIDSKMTSKKRNRKNKEKSSKRKNKRQLYNKEKKRPLTEDENEDDESSDASSDDLLDNIDEIANSLRRSDRIKVIKTKRQVTKEQEIAEKMKKLSYSSDLNKLQDDSEQKKIPTNFTDFDQDQENCKLNQEIIDPKVTITTENTSNNKNEIFEWPSNYENIDENIYLYKKYQNKNKESKKMICDCTYSEQEKQMGIPACGVDCLNRMLLIECGNRCPCGDYCTNKNFKTKNNAKILPFKTENKGWGLKALNDLKSESFLIEYVGEVIDLSEFKNRCEKYSEENNEHFYFMALQNDIFIDATNKGNISRFFNHSCDPNCETQKWTVNGELRIGFFTRRPVKANEELTFDYQFQTVGKKQQKCFCGSEKCRGYLGASSNSQLNNIWESDSEMESSVSELSTNEDKSGSDSENKENKSIQRKQVKSPKRNKDRELNRQIKSIKSLSNKENVLKLCQLMFRTESLDLRLKILDLLLNTKAEISLRLFMDYHGLKLLWSWMIDIDNKMDSVEQLECKLKILEVLSMLPIKNRTILEECKLLVMVKRWSDKGFRPNFDFPIADIDDQNSSIDVWTKKLLENLLDVVLEDSEKKNDQNYKTFCSFFMKIKSKAEDLYTEWSNLKLAFKIPKKQQLEERKEHEREVNELFKDQEKSIILDKTKNSSNEPRFSSKWNSQYKGFNKFYRTKPYYKSRFFWSNNNQNTSGISKEQRRKLFEEKVRQEEEKAAAEAAARAEQDEKDQNQTLSNVKWIFDTRINQWIQCQVPVIPSNLPTCPNTIFSPMINSNQYPILPVPPPPPLPPHLPPIEPFTKIDLSDSNLKNLQQAILQIAHSTHEINKKIQQNNKKMPLSSSKLKSLSSIAAKLPPGWKCKRNKKGMIYYYHIKTKKTQWNFPKVSKTIVNKSKVIKDEVKTKLNKNNELIENKSSQDKLSPAITSTTTEKIDNDLTKSNNSEASTSGLVTASNNSFKAYRDQFREKLSKLIIKILQPFLIKDCKYGHIKTNEDFKHLARKFTHTIMEKEISRTTNLEELDLDKRIKLKAKDYICKYMQKFRDGYSKSFDDI